MKALALLLVPAALLAGEARYARLGEFQGQVEVQLTAADSWMPAERNLPLSESAWLRTGEASRLEIELDDGSAWRLGPDSLGEISDYTTLSTGQHITLLSLDNGIAYFSGEPRGDDVLMLVGPGAHVTLSQGARVRLMVEPGWSQFSVLEGTVRFSSPSAEMSLREGQTFRVEPANPRRFFFYPEVAVLELDRWSESLDRAEAAPVSALHLTWRAGLADLDKHGDWIQTRDAGLVWKPRQDAKWRPYQNGRWRYFAPLGYTWVSDDSWGWMPYHNGRWARTDDLGWFWQPSVSTVFKPGEVYWLARIPGSVGWGPLAPGEQWAALGGGIPTTPPLHFAASITTYAALQPDARLIDPAGFAPPSPEQVKSMVFIPSPPSPAFVAARLEATRPALKVGSTRIRPIVPGVTFSDAIESPAATDVSPEPPQPAPAVIADAPPAVGDGSLPDGIYPGPIIALPIEVPVVINATDHPTYSRPAPVSPPAAIGGQSAAGNPGGESSPSQGRATTPGPAVSPPGSQPLPLRSQSPPEPPSVRPHLVPEPPVHKPAEPPRQAPQSDGDGSRSTGKKLQARAPAPAETEAYNQVLRETDPQAALRALDTWTAGFPHSALADERQYLYLHVYNRLSQPDKVLQYAALLVFPSAKARFPDPTKVLQILVASNASLPKLSHPTPAQTAAGREAANQLLAFLPEYFVPKNKPAGASDAAWQAARSQLEAAARQTLALSARPLRAGN